MSYEDILKTVFPEAAAGGFSRVDGTVAFYNRVQALLRPDMVVVDYGAGRGAAFTEDRCPYRRELRTLRGKVAKVIGLDVDPVVKNHPALDEAIVLEPGRPLPLADGSIDLIVADFVLEHIPDPDGCARELDRILRPGGWLCARTPNRWNYVAIASRLIPKRLHDVVLGRLQPDRKSEDIFPAYYKMNTLSELRRLFPDSRYHDCSYTISAEPAYLPRKPWIWRTALLVDALLPAGLRSNILLFVQKRRSAA